MLVTRQAEILIKADPERIWDFVNDPAQCQRELVYFKTQIERLGKPGVAANTTPNAQGLGR